MQIVVGAQLLLQQGGDLAAVLGRHSGNRELWHVLPPSHLLTRSPTRVGGQLHFGPRDADRYARPMTDSTPEATNFTGFPEAALDFYDDLEIDNSKSFWEAHSDV